MAKARRLTCWVLVVVALAAAVSVPARADEEFSDGTFNDSDWNSTKVVDSTSGTATFSASQVASGGNPGTLRRVTHNFEFDYAEEGAFVVVHLHQGAIHDPRTQGAITSIDYSYDLRNPQPDEDSAIRFSPLLFQDGAYYKATDDNAAGFSWRSYGRTGLVASRFTRIAGSGPVRPNFSANGGPIQFGYVTSNVSEGGEGAGAVSESLQGDIDNWTITVATEGAPEPAFTGCRIEGKNRHLHLHHPAFYTPLGLLYLGLQPLSMQVRVMNDDGPVAGANVEMRSSKPLFPGSDGLPQFDAATEPTDSRGLAVFAINPPRPDPTDMITFTASVTIDGAGYECMGTITTGLGVRLKPYLDTFDQRMDEIEAALQQLAIGPAPVENTTEIAAALPLADSPPEESTGQLALSCLPLVLEKNHGQASVLPIQLTRRCTVFLRNLAALTLLLAAPASAADSVFVERAFEGTWGASFPPFIPQVLGPIRFTQIVDAQGPAMMDQLGGAGMTAKLCPGAGERTEFYEGTYDYSAAGSHVSCTNGSTLAGVYRDSDGSDRGTIRITETNPGANPTWAGTYTNAQGETGQMRGEYQGGGIATPLARLEDGGNGGDGGGEEPRFTGCRMEGTNRHLQLHHPAFYTALGLLYLGLEPPTMRVEVLNENQPVDDASVVVSSSKPAFPGANGLPQFDEATEVTDSSGMATFAINPPRPDPTDLITFTANVTIDGEEYECMGSITTGLGIQLQPYLDTFDIRMDEIEAELERLAMGPAMPAGMGELAALLPALSPPAKALAKQPVLSRLPLVFEENRGQAGPGADFVARVSGVAMLLGARGVRLEADAFADQAVDMAIVGGNESAVGRVAERLSGKSHYLLGSDPSRWVSGAGQAAKVQFDAVYPGIDVVYYGNQQRLEYDFVVAPGADPSQILLRFGEQVPAKVDEAGDLVLERDDLRLKLKKPLIYQQQAEERVLVAGGYRLDPQGNVGFEIGAYDPSQPLVIDPILEFASYLGGSGNDVIADVALDAQGNIYVTGTTSSPGLATEAALATVNQRGGVGEIDGFVAKLDPTGSEIIYLTYVGGSKDDSPFGIAVDAQGNALVTGQTTSEDFPNVQAVQGELAREFAFGGVDAFAVKLNSEGSGLVYSTFLGGGALELEGKIDVDAAGNAYIVSSTTSTDLPVVNAVQPTRGGNAAFGPDAFVAKLSPSGQAIYITYLGGSAEDWGFGIAADSSGNAWVVGGTASADFPVANSFQDTHQGGFDVFLTKISADGQMLLSSGFLGGSSDEMGSSAAVDGAGNVYVTGSTGSSEFPLEGAAQSEPMNADVLAQDAFVAKLSADGTNLLYSTYFGGSGTELSHGIAVGADGSAYIAGETDSVDLMLQGPIQAFNAGRSDAFVAKLSPSGAAIDYATYLGGSADDGAPGLAVDAAGNVVTAGVVYSPDFPVTIGAFQTSRGSEMESFVAKLSPGAAPPSVVSVSGASFVRIHGLAPDSYATAFGENLAASIEVDSTLPTTLNGVTVGITDSNGAMHQARLYVVTPTQISYLIPPDISPGLATITVTRDGQVVATETVRITAVAPGIFSAAASGSGVAAAVFLRVGADGSRTDGLIFDSALAPVPLDLGPGGAEVYVFLFGTGMRNFSGEVTVTVDGVPVPFAGPVAQGQFDGLDQLNLGPLPRELAGRGEVDIAVTIDGKEANVVTVAIQ